MIRLAISVEGETEEEFVKEVLGLHLHCVGVAAYPISLNGNVSTPRLSREMSRLYHSHHAVTSLVDFYGFRGKKSLTISELEQCLFNSIRGKIRDDWDARKVIPYIQKYEFEALLFSDTTAFPTVITTLSPELLDQLTAIRQQFTTPEHINDNPNTSPSHQITDIIPRYNKVVAGPLIAQEIGLPKIRQQCPRFNDWLTSLENLPQSLSAS